MTARFARSLIGLIALASALAGCGGSPQQSVGELLRDKASPRCVETFGRSRVTGTQTPGSVKGPAVALFHQDYSQLDEQYRATQVGWGARPYNDLIPRRAEAKSTGAVQILVCVREIYHQVGIYRPTETQPKDIAAIREEWDVRLVRWPSGEPVSGRSFQGPQPPPQIKVSPDFRRFTGGHPSKDILNWLDGLFAQ